MDEDEEMWFNDDEFDNDGANGSNGDTAPDDDDTAASVPTSSAAAAPVATVAENQVFDKRVIKLTRPLQHVFDDLMGHLSR